MVLGVLSAVTERTTPLQTLVPFCFDGDCYIKPEKIGKSWTDAQQMCKQHNSTLPIVDKPEHKRSAEAALRSFDLNGADVWLGANASDNGSRNWRWLDGSQYSGMGKWNWKRETMETLRLCTHNGDFKSYIAILRPKFHKSNQSWNISYFKFTLKFKKKLFLVCVNEFTSRGFVPLYSDLKIALKQWRFAQDSEGIPSCRLVESSMPLIGFTVWWQNKMRRRGWSTYPSMTEVRKWH